MTTMGLLELVAVTALKGAVVLALAWVATRSLKHHSAATRHFVWSVALATLLLLPVLLLLTPEFRIPVLPRNDVAAAVPDAPVVRSSGVAIAVKAPIPGPDVVTSGVATIAPEVSTGPVAVPDPVGQSVDVVPAMAGEWSPALSSGGMPWWGVALMLWLGGVILLASRWAYGMVVVARVVRDADPVVEPSWYANLEAVRRTMGITREVHLKQTDRVGVPIVWGVRQPVVLLPPAAAEWSPGAQRAVLLHELAHVSRFDALWQGLAQVACAVYWFVPFVWLAAREQRKEQEHACDDRVLDAGTAASQYATSLLAIVQTLGGPGPLERRGPALAMARTSALHGRLRAILDPLTRRHRVSGATRFVATALALLLVVPLAGMRLVQRPLDGDPAFAAGATSAPVLADVASPGTGIAVSPSRAPAPVAVAQRQSSKVSVVPALSVGIDLSSELLAAADTVCQYTDGRKSLSDQSDGTRRWLVEWTGDDCRVEVRAEGEVEFADDLRGLVSISDGGYFQIDVQRGNQRRTLRVEPQGRGLDYRWRVNGNRRDFDDQARAWLADVLVALDRETAFAIDIRFPELWRAGGVGAVLNETRTMADWARVQYYERLLQQPGLSTADLRLVMGQAAEVMTSSYATARLLEAVAVQGLDDPEIRRSFMTAVARMDSDHYKAQALMALMEHGPLSSEEASAVATAAGAIGSDYNRATVLIALLQQPNLDDATIVRVARSAASMESDHYVAQVLQTMIETGRLGSAAKADVRQAFLQATRAMESEHNKQVVLLSLIEQGGLTEDEVGLVMEATMTMMSDHNRSLVMLALVQTVALTETDLIRVVRATGALESDHAKGQVLGAVIARGPMTDQLRQAIVQATELMGSKYQRNEVLAQLAVQ